MTFLTSDEIRNIGFKVVGTNVELSNKTTFYNPSAISIGDNSRIDDFCILSAGKGGIKVGSYVHISCYVSLLGKEEITVGDFSALSTRVAVFSNNDDYSGEFLVNPTVPEQFTNIYSAPVHIGKHTIIGAGSVVMPGVVIGEGVAVGALSFVTSNLDSLGIYAGIPAKKINKRSDNHVTLEKQLKNRSPK